ncbi:MULTISPECIES: alpha/beta fold hydrolase [unclassified Herbaspirillum]|uniref:alpha/beta fold hydrolase n=1 Tax=unclassified Herbaspirillum TaxID=2624150 RepID=UPI001151CF05|nr:MULTISPECIES: alpha/beta hydrolase [unclassified Herbaspirillum]MBB5392157.1 pimeloyl-ACP methyl ester carboxylesterase [Herbaspirillum sp. SJZ102]TQK13614.1 pimeloyl-ACP methyl ester carboxylesterase [Herbaspirillum sp. SJZ130]TQK15617.1 pimeloyl-ACP methyl ester carboxylesterase [Herbaspirillum sp. SJZ106]TWC71516.1 pimeloyl-ACP methyl ester carboxylesterase [Herbaspirillum sp. SJZ099]
MPFALSDGRQIHYQVEGQGAPLLLHHGFTSSLEAWRFFGFTAALRERYRVIMFDALGHGQSDKPHETSAYSQPQRCRDALAVLDALGIERAHFFGYSLGGWVGYGLARHAPERLSSLILGAAHPDEDLSWNAFHGIDGRDPEAFIAAFETLLDERISPQVKMLIRANDLQALAAAAQQPRPSQQDVLARMDMPCLLFCGDADARHGAVQRTAARLARGEFATLPGVTHFGGLMQSALVLPPVLDFLARQSG